MKFIMIALLFVSTWAHAQNRVVSIDAFDLSYTAGLAFKTDNGKTDRDQTNFRFNINYAQNFKQYPGLMWKTRVHVNRLDEDFESQDSYEMTIGAAGGILYNFQPNDIKNSIMAGILGGVERATYEYGDTDDQSGFNFFLELEAGKRWDLGSYSVANISYAPTVSLGFKRYGGDIRDDYFKSGNEVRLNFLKFDILF